MAMTGRRRPRRRLGPILTILVVLAAVAAAVLYWRLTELPNTARETPEYRVLAHPVMVDGEWSGEGALGEGEGLLVPLEIAKTLLGDGVRYEEDSQSIILTTEKAVLHFKTGELDATMNRKPFTLSFAAKEQDGKLYLPFAPLEQLFGIQAVTGASSGIVSLRLPDQSIQTAKVPASAKKAVKLRSGPNKSFPIVEDLAPGTDVTIWGEEEGWYKLQSAEGYLGYAAKSDVVLGEIERTPAAGAEGEEPFVAWKVTGERINLTWEPVYSANPDTSKIGELTGVNVVSPTWFALKDGSGQIISKADAGYSEWARKKGIQVWGLFSNNFEPEPTTEALATYERRINMIQQLLAYAKTFKLNGINLDFENVETSDKDNFVQFVRELAPLAHEQNLALSVDVTPKSSSEYWSLFLDRPRLAEAADYLILMAYDEHWASSPVAGSVASLSWTEQSIVRLLKEDGVPASKLILGMPLYTRMWTETTENGATKVTSKTMSMNSVQELLASKKLVPQLSDTGQNYVEFKEDGATKKIWIEDATSIAKRAELVKKYDLAGAATWRRGFESTDIWAALDQALQSRP
ncbi:glycosyl hydrolase family 18 protein [Cohnella fermenti]|uniref:Glycosyl hydrolase n=1 Tax=Cohnella fermenti TaxID=2565925 RepID=A0A4V3WDP5_9BACL|nr:glycosyl hydrolase family 18 protein [Cohnella fermenti]THF73008.1 glycosyl hydrolase [Cohnella fermenti]